MNVFRSFADILSDRVVHEKGYFFTNKLLWALFIPLLIEQALEFFVGLADSMMVASLGEVAISGVSLVDFLIQLLIFSFEFPDLFFIRLLSVVSLLIFLISCFLYFYVFS